MFSSTSSHFHQNTVSAVAKPSPAECPAAFLCPISHLLLEHPVVTAGGTTYEYAAISAWLAERDTDPLTNERLSSKALIPNRLLRSQVQEWAAAHPKEALTYRNLDAVPFPSPLAATNGSSSSTQQGAKAQVEEVQCALGDVLQFVGESRRLNKAQRSALTPAPVQLLGHTYRFSRCATATVDSSSSSSSAPSFLCVSVDGPASSSSSQPMRMPSGSNALFATRQGLVFYNEDEVHETRVAVSSSSDEDAAIPAAAAAVCRYGAGCTNRACTAEHPFACRYGVLCRDKAKCNRLHPESESVVPLGENYPLSTACKHGTACSNSTCHFAHPMGRCGAQRVRKQLVITHAHDLSLLATPVPLDIGTTPLGATKWSFQGEFAFFFTPYPGAWAKAQHFRSVSVHRFTPKTQTYCAVKEYELEGHYCNSAVGSGRFFVLSWWPYEAEAMRTMWEAVRRERVLLTDSARMEATISALQATQLSKESELSSLRSAAVRDKAAVAQLKSRVASQEAAARVEAQRRKAAQATKQAAYEERKAAQAAKQSAYEERKAAKQSAYEERKAVKAQERAWAQRMRDSARQSERFRMLDPIHVYALQGNADATDGADWTLVLDYHKGAHALKLEAPDLSSSSVTRPHHQRLLVTEKDSVFAFDLVAPADLQQLHGTLPVVPGRLCAGF